MLEEILGEKQSMRFEVACGMLNVLEG